MSFDVTGGKQNSATASQIKFSFSHDGNEWQPEQVTKLTFALIFVHQLDRGKYLLHCKS